MKKILVLVLVIFVLLCGCSSNNSGSNNSDLIKFLKENPVYVSVGGTLISVNSREIVIEGVMPHFTTDTIIKKQVTLEVSPNAKIVVIDNNELKSISLTQLAQYIKYSVNTYLEIQDQKFKVISIMVIK